MRFFLIVFVLYFNNCFLLTLLVENLISIFFFIFNSPQSIKFLSHLFNFLIWRKIWPKEKKRDKKKMMN
jgi:hypothetical protein